VVATLLAKSWDVAQSPEAPAYARLVPHLRAVETSGEAIADAAGPMILGNLGLDAGLWLPRLRLALACAGLLHDVGKANGHFQLLVRGKASGTIQPVRHELLTVLFLLRNWGGLSDWLRERLVAGSQAAVAEELCQVIIAAVGGQHLKLDEEWRSALPAETCGGGGAVLEVLLGHPDLQQIFGEAKPENTGKWSLLPSDPTSPAKSQLQFRRSDQAWRTRLRGDRE